MSRIRKVDPTVMVPKPREPAPRGRRVSPEQQKLIARMKSITDENVVYEVVLEEGEKPLTIRQQIIRAARAAGVEVAVRKSEAGFYVGLMTPERRVRRGRQAGGD